jgi:hypothetical protein
VDSYGILSRQVSLLYVHVANRTDMCSIIRYFYTLNNLEKYFQNSHSSLLQHVIHCTVSPLTQFNHISFDGPTTEDCRLLVLAVNSPPLILSTLFQFKIKIINS